MSFNSRLLLNLNFAHSGVYGMQLLNSTVNYISICTKLLTAGLYS